MKKEIIITKDNLTNQRIDLFLVNELNLSREKIQKLIKEELILVNQKPTKPKYGIKLDDVISCQIIKSKPFVIKPQKMNLDIVFEDDDLIVINKQNNIVVHPGAGNLDKTLVNGVLYHTKILSQIGGEIRPGVVHRIDKKTTGLIVFAKNDLTYYKLTEQFATKVAKREYFAIVIGVVPHQKGVINAPIGRSSSDRKKMAVSPHGKIAITNFEVVKYFSNHTLLKLNLQTGRTHQIRVHLKYINFPILGDEVYGLKKQKDDFGQYLHAKSLSFIHPKNKKVIQLDCELPKQFKIKLQKLEENND